MIAEYYREGKPSYHPKTMLKVLVYANMDNTYVSRKIEKTMRENINYMWLSGRTEICSHIAEISFKRIDDLLS